MFVNLYGEKGYRKTNCWYWFFVKLDESLISKRKYQVRKVGRKLFYFYALIFLKQIKYFYYFVS